MKTSRYLWTRSSAGVGPAVGRGSGPFDVAAGAPPPDYHRHLRLGDGGRALRFALNLSNRRTAAAFRSHHPCLVEADTDAPPGRLRADDWPLRGRSVLRERMRA